MPQGATKRRCLKSAASRRLTYRAMSGASLIEIAEILGHKTLAMVRRYSHFTQAHTQGGIERMAQQFLSHDHRAEERD